MNKDEALKIILSDIKQAKQAKKEIDDQIETWLKEYEGLPYGNESKGRSAVVSKDIKKAVEWFLPNAIGPFVDRSKVINLEGVTAEDVAAANMHERLLNFQFVRKFDRYNFIHDMFNVGATEGTTVIRVGWDYQAETDVETVNSVDAQFLASLDEQGIEYKIINSKEQDEEFEELIDTDMLEVEDTEELYDIKIYHERVIKNQPTAEVVRNGNFYPDPSVDRAEDMMFAAYKYESTISDLKASGKYSDEDIDELALTLAEQEEGLENTRNNSLQNYGRSSTYESEAKSLKKVTVYEYWGHIDLNDDGIAEPIMATVVNDKLLEIDENPMPDKKIPFVIIPYVKKAYSLWGAPIAELISDNQKIRTSLLRGFIDNVAQSNNGKKFIKKGSLDVLNKRKYEQNLGGLIEFNQEPGMIEGNFNQLPPSIFNLYELIQQEAESLSGINRTAQGLDSGALNDSATGAAIQNDQGQKRIKDVVRRYSEGIKQVFRHWIAYNKEFLNEEEVMRISGEYIEFRRDDISGEFDIEIEVGVSGVTEAKVNQMVMLLQQVSGLAQQVAVPPNFFNMILAKVTNEWGYPDIAKVLEEAQRPEGPTQAEMQAQQMQMEKLMAEIEELKSKAELNKAKSFDTMSGANGKNVDNKMKAKGIVNPKGM